MVEPAEEGEEPRSRFGARAMCACVRARVYEACDMVYCAARIVTNGAGNIHYSLAGLNRSLARCEPHILGHIF